MAYDFEGVPERIRIWIETSKIDLEVFGPGTRPQDISFCAHHLDTCECIREFAWSRASSGDNRVEVPISSPNLCKHHDHLWHHGVEVHHQRVVEENQHKNRAFALMMEHLPPHLKIEHKNKEGAVVGFSPHKHIHFFYSADRELHFDLDHVPEIYRAKVQSEFDRNYTSRRTFVKR